LEVLVVEPLDSVVFIQKVGVCPKRQELQDLHNDAARNSGSPLTLATSGMIQSSSIKD